MQQMDGGASSGYRVVIIGGGTTGWSAAAALAPMIGSGIGDVTLVETADIPTIGVGEATIPHIRGFNAAIGLAEADFLRETHATVKLGIQFEHWHRLGASYFHPFGETVRRIGGVDLHHYIAEGQFGIDDEAAFSPATIAARSGRGVSPSMPPPPVTQRAEYAYHFDAGLYSPLLRSHAIDRGVVRCDGKVVGARRRAEDGFVEAVVLADGRTITGDLFVDCSGFRALLIDATDNPFRDWSRWLPCNRAVAAPCPSRDAPLPYTRSIAERAGWRWRIPLQHRVGNGYVFCDAFLDDAGAIDRLATATDVPSPFEPRIVPFVTGRRARPWDRNVVALGLAAGFLEPLESTGIYFAQRGAMLLLDLFPTGSGNASLRDEYNRIMGREFEQVRDFLVLHYTATERTDSAFWHHCRSIERPDSLNERIALFEEQGVFAGHQGFFNTVSWAAVLLGQGIRQRVPDPRLAAVPRDWAKRALATTQDATQRWVNEMQRAAGPIPSRTVGR